MVIWNSFRRRALIPSSDSFTYTKISRFQDVKMLVLIPSQATPEFLFLPHLLPRSHRMRGGDEQIPQQIYDDMLLGSTVRVSVRIRVRIKVHLSNSKPGSHHLVGRNLEEFS